MGSPGIFKKPQLQKEMEIFKAVHGSDGGVGERQSGGGAGGYYIQ